MRGGPCYFCMYPRLIKKRQQAEKRLPWGAGRYNIDIAQKGKQYEEKKVKIAYFNEWEDDYDHGFFYVPDIEWKYGGTYKGEPTYQPITVEFIEY